MTFPTDGVGKVGNPWFQEVRGITIAIAKSSEGMEIGEFGGSVVLLDCDE